MSVNVLYTHFKRRSQVWPLVGLKLVNGPMPGKRTYARLLLKKISTDLAHYFLGGPNFNHKNALIWGPWPECSPSPHPCDRLCFCWPAPHWGIFITRPTGGLFRALPPLISETTGPTLKIQAVFESPGKTAKGNKFYWPRGHEWRHRSDQS